MCTDALLRQKHLHLIQKKSHHGFPIVRLLLDPVQMFLLFSNATMCNDVLRCVAKAETSTPDAREIVL
jgi:hypothetical protein